MLPLTLFKNKPQNYNNFPLVYKPWNIWIKEASNNMTG